MVSLRDLRKWFTLSALSDSSLPCEMLGDHVQTLAGQVAIGTTHLGKGLEFRAIAVIACDNEIIPLQERIETVADDATLKK